MKIVFSKQAYDNLTDESRCELSPISCDCVKDGLASLDCDMCDGGGVIYEDALSPEDAAAIQENLRSQGVPLGKNRNTDG